MKEREGYEIDLLEFFAVCLSKWKQIIAFAIITAMVSTCIAILTFEAPPSDSLEYRQIENAIINRKITEDKIASKKQSLEDNQFYLMEAENIVRKKLTFAVELLDQSVITDQIDPTDMVLYAYQNLARTELSSNLLPTVMTKLQIEQLFEIGYDTSTNTLAVSMISDDEYLIDTVLALVVDWYLSESEDISALTQEHKLTVLPIAVTHYDRETAENMVSSVNDEIRIRELEDKVIEYNTELDELFVYPENTAVSMTVDELMQKFNEKKDGESSPGILKAIFMGGLIGTAAAVLFICTKKIAYRTINSDTGIESTTGWKRIGRIKKIKRPLDPICRKAKQMLHRNAFAEEKALFAETGKMASLILSDVGIVKGASVALVGDVSSDDFIRLTECLAPYSYRLATSPLSSDRVSANIVSRECDGIIFVAKTDLVRAREVDEMEEIASAIGKAPIGYILV